MIRHIAAVALVAACMACAAPVRASDDTTPRATATASITDGGVRIRYVLTTPVQALAFADEDVVREAWTVVTPGLALSDDSIRGDAPFDTFELELRPDTAERDRIYMGLSRVGQGYIMYGPGLKLKDIVVDLNASLAPGQVSRPAATAIEGYSYIGDGGQLTTEGQAVVIAGDNVPSGLSDPMRQAFSAAIAFYARRLTPELPYQPTLAISVDSPGPPAFRGDVTDTGVISTRFRGDSWRGAEDYVVTFVWHEAFHLWNGHGIRALDAGSAPWLHEGGAEYASIVGATSTGSIDETVARQRLARHLNRCRSIVGDQSYDASRLRSGNGPYACGTVAHWLADLELGAAGRGDVFDLWRDMLAEARRGGGYTVADFNSRLVADSAVETLFASDVEDRWTTLRSRFAALGVSLENRPGSDDLMAAALFHVAKRNCKSGSYGFFNDPGALRLDGADCGVLSGEPFIATVEDLDPQADGRALFDAVQARCAASQPVRYRTRDGQVLEAVCDTPLAEPQVWAITDSPALAR